MARQLPLVSAALTAQTGLPPLVFVVRAERTRSDEQALLDECVSISLETHPAVASVWQNLGVRPGALSFSLPTSKVTAALRPLSGGVVCVQSGSRWKACRRQEDLSGALGFEVDFAPGAPRPTAASGMQVRLSREKSRVRFTVHTPAVSVAGVDIKPGWKMRTTASAAFSIIESIPDRVVLDGSAGAWSSLVRLHSSACVARPLAEAPGLCLLSDGSQAPVVLPVEVGLSRLSSAQIGEIACHPFVADMAAIRASDPVPDPVLYPHQQRCVGEYLASRWGLLCALPPGSGKTVVAARALHHRARNGATLALVVVPSQLTRQWESALGRFHPTATVLTELPPGLSAQSSSPVVLLLSYDKAVALQEELVHLGVDDFVVDEAHVLSTSSARAGSLRRLRASATRCMLLTGTPEEKGLNRLGTLAAVVLDQDVFASVPLGAPHAAQWSDRVGPILATAPSSEGLLPTLHRRILEVEPSSEELAEFAQAQSDVDSAMAALAAASTPGLLATARLQLTNAHRRLQDVLADPGVEHATKRSELLRLVSDQEPTVVCVRSARVAREVSSFLSANGVPAVALTSELTPQKKAAAASSFPERVRTIVCAESSSRGWDIPSAARVVHLDAPLSANEELQRSSRARRISSSLSEIDVVFLAYRGTTEHAAVSSVLHLA